MMRSWCIAVRVLFLLASSLLARELKGEDVELDPAKQEIVFKVEGKQLSLPYDNDTQLYTTKDTINKSGIKGIKSFKSGRKFDIKTGDKDGVEVLTELKPSN